MKKNIFLVFIIVLLSTIGYWSYNHFLTKDDYSPVLVENTQKLLSNLKASENLYTNKIDSLDKANHSLQSKVSKAQAALSEVKKENSSLRQAIDDLLEIHYTSTDTTMKMENCDSMAIALQDLLILDATKDSIYENLSSNLQLQLTLKDSTIAFQRCQYDTLKNNYKDIIIQQESLLQDNAKFQRTIKKQRKENTFLSVIIVAVGSMFVIHSFK